MRPKIEISPIKVGDVEDSLMRISGVLNMFAYVGETGSIINPEYLVDTILMIRDALDQQIDALRSIRNGVCGDGNAH